MSSILNDTKAGLGILATDSEFDVEIMLGINNALSDLNDIGVGPEAGFVIEDDDVEWEEFIEVEDPLAPAAKVQLSRVKLFVVLKTRLSFDPPTTSILQNSIESQLEQLIWRLSVNRENTDWQDPNPPVVVAEEGE